MQPAAWLTVPVLLLVAACSGDDSVSFTAAGGSGGAASGAGGGLAIGGSPGSGGGAECVSQSAKAELTRLPVDVIVVADTSSSMGAVTSAIELNINTKLTDTLEKAQLDYRVVLIAGYGSGSAICVQAPLGGGKCSPVPKLPALSPKFLHYDQATGSSAFFSTILSTFTKPDAHGFAPKGWSAFLRDDSKKVFLAFTDAKSGPSTPGAQFDEQLLALSPAKFGTTDSRSYVFHTFAGVATPPDPTQPWLPSHPVVGSGCGYPKALPLQDLSILSGGLRYPLCSTQSYDAVFETIAKDVVTQVAVSCEFEFPKPAGGQTLDPDTIQIEYTQGGGAKQTFTQVKSAAECTASSFYVEGEAVLLCADACDAVQADEEASLDVTYGCDVGFVK